jgi:hypothetical protein
MWAIARTALWVLTYLYGRNRAGIRGLICTSLLRIWDVAIQRASLLELWFEVRSSPVPFREYIWAFIVVT